MTVLELANQLILEPIRLLLEIIFGTAYNITRNSGAAIIPLSLAVNFLLLPFYLRADMIQHEEQELQKRGYPQDLLDDLFFNNWRRVVGD